MILSLVVYFKVISSFYYPEQYKRWHAFSMKNCGYSLTNMKNALIICVFYRQLIQTGGK